MSPSPTRNHSEIALRQFGAAIHTTGLRVAIAGRPRLQSQGLTVPSDISSAAFFLAAALLLPDSQLSIEGVGLNPTRTELLDVLRGMGADIEITRREDEGEPVGDLQVRGPQGQARALRGGVIEGAATAGVIDEIPMLAVLGAMSEQGLTIRDAAELRVKETDRIATVAENLGRMGVQVQVFDDGMKIPGNQRLQAAAMDSFGDHRVAMAFTIAALASSGPCTMKDAEAAAVSFPGFYQTLDGIVVR